MPSLSLRLPDDLEQRLDKEARLEGVPRSEVARAAIDDFLARRERERFLAELVAEARAAYGNQKIRGEASALAEEFLDSDNAALDLAEGREAGAGEPDESGESWWK